MSTSTPTFGPWTASSRTAATLLAPVSVAAATGLSFAAADAAVGGAARAEAMTSPRNHKYINRPGSPPRGRHR